MLTFLRSVTPATWIVVGCFLPIAIAALREWYRGEPMRDDECHRKDA